MRDASGVTRESTGRRKPQLLLRARQEEDGGASPTSQGAVPGREVLCPCLTPLSHSVPTVTLEVINSILYKERGASDRVFYPKSPNSKG